MSKYGYRCEGRKVREDTESWDSVQAYVCMRPMHNEGSSNVVPDAEANPYQK